MRCKRLAAFVLAMLLPLTGARAFQPRALSGLTSAYEQGQPIRLELSGEPGEWKELSKGSLTALAEWLKDVLLEIDISASAYAARLFRQGEELFSLREGEHEGRRLLTMGHAGPGFLAAEGDDPLSLLLGEDPDRIVRMLRLLDFTWLQDFSDGALPLLEPYGKEVRRSTTLKNVGTSPQRLEYSLTPEVWDTIWPHLKEALPQIPENLSPELKEALDGLSFDSPVTVRRLQDKQGSSLGWQMNATVTLSSGVSRRVNLTGSRAEGKGLYLSLKAPATCGKDDLSFALSVAEDEQHLNADWSFVSRLGTERYNLKGSVKLKLSDSPAGERLSGRLWSEEKRGSDSARRLTLEPDLNFNGTQAQGSIRLLEQRAGKPWLDLNLSLSASAGEVPELSVPQTVYELETDLLSARDALGQSLLPVLRRIMMGLPEDQRLLLLHDMGRTARTEGETVPLLDETPEFIVTEDAL